MDPIDSIKRSLDDWLPGNHRWALLALVSFLFVITHDNDYVGVTLQPRQPVPAITQTETLLAEESTEEQPAVTAQENTQIKPEPAKPENLVANLSAPELSNAPVAQHKTESPDYVTEVKSGDNLSLIFTRAGLTAQDVYLVSSSTPQTRLLSNLYPGYKLEFYFSDDKSLEQLNVIKSQLESLEITRDEQGQYIATEITREPDIRQVFREATIDDSLFLAAQRSGISAGVTMELAGIFGGVIDFLLDTRQGDTFNLMYEEKYLDGEYIGNGRILAAQFTNQDETFTAVRYVNRAGKSDFYNTEGESMRKAFLRNPVDFTRISSSFNLRRKHPILNTIRAHKGTDYAAPRGTPVVATGDGRVTFAGRNGSFGKLVVIQHGERFQTKYAHLNGYANGIKKGKRIKQGQIIGYVGSTGGATGPHLHYEFLMDGAHRNSRTIHNQLPKAESVPREEIHRFREHTQILLTQLENYMGDTQKIAHYHPAD